MIEKKAYWQLRKAEEELRPCEDNVESINLIDTRSLTAAELFVLFLSQ